MAGDRPLPREGAQFPNVTALSAAMFAGDDDDRFEFGLELLVRGLAAHARTAGRRRRTG
jgi:hypothetical protein